jgi:hypothetical protein
LLNKEERKKKMMRRRRRRRKEKPKKSTCEVHFSRLLWKIKKKEKKTTVRG